MAGPPPESTARSREVGRVAGVHSVPFAGTRPPHVVLAAGRRGPVAGLVATSRAAGASFAEHLADYVDELVALEGCSTRSRRTAPATATCGPTTCAGCAAVGCASSTGTLARAARARSWRWCSSSSGAVRRRGRALRDAYRDAGGPVVQSRRAFSMLIAHSGTSGSTRSGSGSPPSRALPSVSARRRGRVPGPAAVPPSRHRGLGDPRRLCDSRDVISRPAPWQGRGAV